MSWLVTLLLLAIIAFFVVKYIMSNAKKRQAEIHQTSNEQTRSGVIEHGSEQRPSSAGAESALTNDSALNESKSHQQFASSTASIAGDNASTHASTNTSHARTATAGVATAAAGAAAAGSSFAKSATSGVAAGGVHTGDTLSDVREMIKILNLDAPDASRLAIGREQLLALRKGDANGIPDASGLEDIAERLRGMLS